MLLHFCATYRNSTYLIINTHSDYALLSETRLMQFKLATGRPKRQVRCQLSSPTNRSLSRTHPHARAPHSHPHKNFHHHCSPAPLVSAREQENVQQLFMLSSEYQLAAPTTWSTGQSLTFANCQRLITSREATPPMVVVLCSPMQHSHKYPGLSLYSSVW